MTRVMFEIYLLAWSVIREQRKGLFVDILFDFLNRDFHFISFLHLFCTWV